MNSNIYFLENITPNYGDNLQQVNSSTLVLLNVSNEQNRESNKSSLTNQEDNYEYRVIETSHEKITNLKEGQYVYFDENNFINANGSDIAKRNIFFNNFYRGRLLFKNLDRIHESNPFLNPEVHSYHINVGHGNCSIIVIKDSNCIKVWMVDCSDFDFMNSKSYRSNIDECFNHISKKFKLKSIEIDTFFLTHLHYDHYSGISGLINQKIINSNTILYINMHYAMASPNYNRLLKKINQLNPIIIEPLSSYSNNEIDIWHPHMTTIKSMSSKYSRIANVQVEPNPNNASAVYHLRIGDKSILLPGDLETAGWNSINKCFSHLNNSNYFAISHHGSLNGHLRNTCPVKLPITNLSHCIHTFSTPILMGRDNAFRGIYSPQVIQDFQTIFYSEKDNKGNPCSFMEIDWQSNNKIWY
ncbi:MAG: MBL fold metallo-hydrolase [Flavobacteriales bacterium]|nr:MBL fold metallo-hydrolase [Flavobacteriales bacterium]